MNKKSRKSGPYYDGDPKPLVELIRRLIAQKYYVDRKSRYHLKIRYVVNFWPTTGKIMIDGEKPLIAKGIEHLEQQLNKRFPQSHSTKPNPARLKIDANCETADQNYPNPPILVAFDTTDLQRTSEDTVILVPFVDEKVKLK